MKISFFTVVYNNIYDTEKYLRSLSLQVEVPSSVGIQCIVIDNSTNTDIILQLNELVSEFEFAVLLRPGQNLGYFGGFNYAFDNTVAASSDFVVLCNNDLVFDKHFVHKLCSKVYPNECHVICPDVVTLDEIHQNPHVLKPLGFFQRSKLDLYFSNYYIARLLVFIRNLLSVKSNKGKKKRLPTYIHMGIGACYLLNKGFFKHSKRLNYPFFLYGEEAFLTKQVHDHGGKLFYDPDLVVQHAESATLSKLPSRIIYNFARDGYFVYRRYY